MKRGLTLSLILNVPLVGLAFCLALSFSSTETRTPISRSVGNYRLPTRRHPVLPQEVVGVESPFDWAQIETTDYRVYVANLRAIGCPESTVRDILIADVNDLFNGRVKALVDEVNGQFWDLLTHEQDFKKVVEEKATLLSTLKTERDEVYVELFGNPNPLADEEQRDSAAIRREQWGRIADFLPEEKRVRFVAARETLEREWTEYLRTPGLVSVQQQTKRKELDSAHDQALRNCLTTDEYGELRLRQSCAESLRERFQGLDLSDDEVRTAAIIQFAATDGQRALLRDETDSKSRQSQLQQLSEARIRELLGEDRYAALQRATDDRYEPIHRVTRRLELPDSIAAEAYDIRRQSEDAARQLRDNISLAPEERQAMLQAITVETRQSLSAMLGSRGFAAYEKIDGSWMQKMSAPRR